MNYYNDNDKFCAKWLKNLIDAKLIPEGYVDDRSITDIEPNDLKGFKQCHFFAGIGGWPYALRLADWPEDREVWTGSCPCQPFSVAGKGGGTDDERHLWPAFRWLIAQRRPATVFGEQVASSDGRLWLTGVRTDLEAMGFTVGAADLCAAGVGAPHIRQRLWWVAESKRNRRDRQTVSICGQGQEKVSMFTGRADSGGLADTQNTNGRGLRTEHTRGRSPEVGRPSGIIDRLGNPSRQGLPQRGSNGRVQPETMGPSEGQAAIGSVWHHSITIPCADGKSRRIPTQSILQPLAPRLPNRVGALRGVGNSINPWVAKEFIQAYMDVEND